MGGEEVDNISFASSHGHFIELSQSLGGYTHVVGEEVKPLLRIAETALLAWLTTIAPAGLTLENTGLSISLHYRNLVGPSPERLAIVEAAVDEVVACSKGVLEKRVGKLVWEIRPSLGWGKGKALLWVIEKTKALLGENLAVLCCGDDATDEVRGAALAYLTLRARPLSHLTSHPHASPAHARTPSPSIGRTCSPPSPLPLASPLKQYWFPTLWMPPTLGRMWLVSGRPLQPFSPMTRRRSQSSSSALPHLWPPKPPRSKQGSHPSPRTQPLTPPQCQKYIK